MSPRFRQASLLAAAPLALLLAALPAVAQVVNDPVRVITDGDPASPDDLILTLPLADDETITGLDLLEAGQATPLLASFRIERSAPGESKLTLTPAIDLDRFIGHDAALRLTTDKGTSRLLPLAIAGPAALTAVRSLRQAVPDDATDYRPILPLTRAGNLHLLGLHDAQAAALDYRTVLAGDGRQAALGSAPRPLAGAPHAYAARYRLSPGGQELAQPLALTPTPRAAYTRALNLVAESENGRLAFTLAGGINVDLIDLRSTAGRSLLERFEQTGTASGDRRLILRSGQSLADLGAPGTALTLSVERRVGNDTLTQPLTLNLTPPAGSTATGSAGQPAAGTTSATRTTSSTNTTAPLPTPTPAAPPPATDPDSRFPKEAERVVSTESVETPLRRPRVSAAARALGTNVTRYEYNAVGANTAIVDPFGNLTRIDVDQLSRPLTQTLPAPGDGSPAPVIRTGHDALDRLIALTDPRGLTTTYTYDALDQVTQLSSPDTGLTRSTTDGAGNPVTRTDARGQSAQHSYDALNRLVSSTWPGATGNELKTVTYTWDSPRIGSLGSVEERDATGQLLARSTYTYDAQGRRSGETRTLGNATPTTLGWTYAAGGRLQRQTYPSGRSLDYSHDAAGRITAISTTAPGSGARPLVTNVAYTGLGQVRAYTLGNGQTQSRSFDADGRLTGHSQGAGQVTLTYDAASRIVAVTDSADPGRNATYTYDKLGRLTGATRGTTTTTYTWDAAGNRLSRQRTVSGSPAGTATDTYQPAATSNRLQSITPAGGTARPVQYDAAGNLTGDGPRGFTYDARGRLTQAILAASVRYQVDAFGRRVRKAPGQPGETVYHYDPDGRLIAESAPDGSRLREYVWLNDLPVAVLVGGAK